MYFCPFTKKNRATNIPPWFTVPTHFLMSRSPRLSRSVISFLLLVLVCTSKIIAQDSLVTIDSRWDLLKTDTRNTVKSVLFAYERPLRWQKKNWHTAGMVVLGTIGLYFVDEKLQPSFIRQRSKIPHSVDELAFYFGKPQYNYGLTAAIYTIGLITKSPQIRKTGVVLIASATAAGLIQSLSKNTFGRARPSTNVGNGVFDFFNGTPDYHSFPSGHAILAFTTAHVLALQTKKPLLKVGIYALGLVTPASRLWHNAHWLSDVGLSLVISVVTANSINRYIMGKKTYQAGTPQIKWQLKTQLTGISLVGAF